jgi:hypothetical protein
MLLVNKFNEPKLQIYVLIFFYCQPGENAKFRVIINSKNLRPDRWPKLGLWGGILKLEFSILVAANFATMTLGLVMKILGVF